MSGFGAPSATSVDQRARDAAAAAQADADALESLVALRASRMRVYRSTSKSLGGTSEELIGTDTIDYATGAFASQADASRIVIPAGVSKVRVRMTTVPGGNVTGWRAHWARLYNADNSVAEAALAFARKNTSSVSVAEYMRSESPVFAVTPGQYLHAYVRLESAGGVITVINSVRECNALEVDVIE